MVKADGTTRSAYLDELYCPECGYSLRGLTSDRCPECGLLLDFIESDVSLIPWERRRELGWLRAYWQTVLYVLTRTKIFCRAAYRPVSYADAQRFRWISIAHAYIPMLLILSVIYWVNPNLLGWVADETGWWFVVLACVCVLLSLLAFTGLPSYFFHPRYLPVEQQNRAIALSYYGCAPLAFLPVVAGLVLGLNRIWSKPQEPFWAAIAVAAVLVPFNLFLCWNSYSLIARYTLKRSVRRIWLTWTLPLLWIVLCPLILVVPCAVAYFLALVFYSLRSGSLLP